ncbi:MAG: hypothetical protein KAS73_08980 [Candidatus Sabulitectum sp.]|nr:hypothetical protein [Candidatus Sabulitectum sp.]
MSYFCVVSFDLEGAKASDYDTFYKKLAQIGLNSKLHHVNNSIIDLPSTTVAGSLTGIDTSEVVSIAENELKLLYKKLNLKGKYFIFSGANWAWNGKSVT